MSAPAPGPNGMMNRTGCCGQACVCACAGGTATARIATRAMTRAQSFDISQNPDAQNDERKLERLHKECRRPRNDLGLLPSPLWGGVGVGVVRFLPRWCQYCLTAPPPPRRFAPTLPTRGRVAPSLPLALVHFT